MTDAPEGWHPAHTFPRNGEPFLLLCNAINSPQVYPAKWSDPLGCILPIPRPAGAAPFWMKDARWLIAWKPLPTPTPETVAALIEARREYLENADATD